MKNKIILYAVLFEILSLNFGCNIKCVKKEEKNSYRDFYEIKDNVKSFASITKFNNGSKATGYKYEVNLNDQFTSSWTLNNDSAFTFELDGTYVYNNKSQLIKIITNSDSTIFEYDNSGNQIFEECYNSNKLVRKVTKTFGINNLVVKKIFKYDWGNIHNIEQTDYLYNSCGNLILEESDRSYSNPEKSEIVHSTYRYEYDYKGNRIKIETKEKDKISIKKFNYNEQNKINKFEEYTDNEQISFGEYKYDNLRLGKILCKLVLVFNIAPISKDN